MKHLGLLLLVLGITGCSSSSNGEKSTGQGLDCSVCNHVQFDCAVGSGQGTATIAGTDADGCFGTITVDETDQLWLRCGASQVCVEHDDECFDATGNSAAFSFVVPDKDLHVTCSAQ